MTFTPELMTSTAEVMTFDTGFMTFGLLYRTFGWIVMSNAMKHMKGKTHYKTPLSWFLTFTWFYLYLKLLDIKSGVI